MTHCDNFEIDSFKGYIQSLRANRMLRDYALIHGRYDDINAYSDDELLNLNEEFLITHGLIDESEQIVWF